MNILEEGEEHRRLLLLIMEDHGGSFEGSSKR